MIHILDVQRDVQCIHIPLSYGRPDRLIHIPDMQQNPSKMVHMEVMQQHLIEVHSPLRYRWPDHNAPHLSYATESFQL